MKKIEVTVREIDKGTSDLTLLNVREELVNVLYKETVAYSTKADQQFYVLLFFVYPLLTDRTEEAESKDMIYIIFT